MHLNNGLSAYVILIIFYIDGPMQYVTTFKHFYDNCGSVLDHYMILKVKSGS